MPHRPFPSIPVVASVTFVTLLTFLALPAPGRALEVPARFQGKLHSCPIADADGKGEALCGSYEVFENREARSGRKIALQISLLPATGPDPAPDPLFFLSGGPGEGAVASAEEFLQSPFRVQRDIVLVDTRGTGGSNGLFCQLWGDGRRLDRRAGAAGLSVLSESDAGPAGGD